MERSLFRPRVWRRFDLPDALFPLYALLSPVEWGIFHLRHRLATMKRAVRPAADIGLAIEAGCMLTFFRIALRFLPVQKLTAWMSRPDPGQMSMTQEMAAQTLRRIEWSIEAAVRHAPQCLAAYFMLRRRHIASRLFYGVAREANQLKAHTWVKVGDRTVVGGDVESHFTVLTTFP
jgi:Transglutaminase-like superfamily